MSERLYRVLNTNGSTYHGGSGVWSLPNGKPGKWMKAIKGELIACERGYHLVTIDHLCEWLGPAIFEAEGRGENIDDGNKQVWREARLIRRLENWNEKTSRSFSADCAKHVLPIYENLYPKDNRPRLAIKAARLFANGNIAEKERDAAGDAARAAAWAAAWDKERKWQIDLLKSVLEVE